MATNTKIVLMDLTDDWNPRTVDKLNYDLKSLKLGIDDALSKLESNDYPENEHGIPAGGNQNQVLAKASATDYDVHWVDQSGGGGTQVQSDWTQTDTNEPSYIQHKPENLVQDASYVHTNNNYTDSDKNKLNGIAAGAEVNVQADWNVTDSTSDAFINHKPTIPTKTSDLTNDSDFVESSDLATVATTGDYDDLTDKPSLATVATSGSYNDLSNKPTIPAAQIQSDWNQTNTSSADYIKNKPAIPAAPVQSDWNEADTSSLAYIENKPTIPAAGLPAEGDTGQVLAKISDDDYDADWVTPQSAGIVTTWYGTCSTAANVQEKTVTCSNFRLSTGAVIGILFSNSNSRGDLTLNINGRGAKSVYTGQQPPGQTYRPLIWSNSSTLVYVMYDGSRFRLLSIIDPITGTRILDGTGAYYGLCESAASAQVKVADIPNASAEPAPGTSVHLYMSEGNSVTDRPIYLSLNGSENNIYYDEEATSSTHTLTWAAGDTLEFVFFYFGLMEGFGWEYVGGSSTMPIKGTYSYNDLSDKPAIPAAPVQSNWNETDATSLAYIKNKPGITSLQVVSGYADNQSVSASSYVGVLIDITVPSGYTPIGVVGVHLANASSSGAGVTLASIAQFYVSSSTQAYVRIKNPSSSALKLKVTADVLCMKVS